MLGVLSFPLKCKMNLKILVVGEKMSKLVKFAKSVSPSTGHNHQLNENEESKVKSSDPSSQKKQNPRKASGKEKKDLI